MKKICIIGFGRFGRLLAKMLSSQGKIFVIEKNRLSAKGVKRIKYKDLGQMDWVIVAVPISSVEDVLKKANPFLKEGCLLSDVCSVKVYPCRWMKRHIKKEVEILGIHPMFGPDSARYGLKGLQIILCSLRISKASLAEIKKIFRSLDLRVIETTPDDHDKQAARSLSFVHFLGRALGEMKVGKQRISSMGFERLLAVNETVTNDTWQLFFDMQRYNPYAAKTRKKFKKSCEKIEERINKTK